MTDSIESSEKLRDLLLDSLGSLGLDDYYSVSLRVRDWLTLAKLWWHYGGEADMIQATKDDGYNPLALPITPCMRSGPVTGCTAHGPDCTRERINIEMLFADIFSAVLQNDVWRNVNER